MKEIPQTETKAGQPSEVKPWHVLAFTLAVFALLFVIMLFFPQNGIKVNDQFTLYFPTMAEFFAGDTTVKPDMEEVLAELTAPADTMPAKSLEDSLRKSLKKIQYPNGDRSILYPVFAALEKARRGPGTSRVIHFGDSQIEGDRMTSLIRVRLQEKFGGSGPGMVAARPLVKSFSIIQDYSESMRRYALFAGRDTLVKHRRYGAMATFSRFSDPFIADSLLVPGDEKTGWVSLSRSGGAYNKSKRYSVLRFFYGHNHRTFKLKLFLDGTPHQEDSFPASNRFHAKEWHFKQTPKKVMMIMSGEDSPNIYGVSLESERGIQVDNVSMRGSSGTVFGGIAYGSLKPMLDVLNVKLFLLQYGGNTVPYIRSKEAAERYGKDFKRQIAFLKKQVPGAGVIVIGPSDMAKKVKGKLQSYAHLVDVRDALKQAAFESEAAYFDIYEVMGGQNSMIQWVEEEEGLAGSDYVHFTPKGAKLIAEKFISSLMEDYEAYQKIKVQ
ncbi:MAG TPA: hypothetical protein ENJ82_03720 [Bacteroidetes bacterium]|nr:hypothetical protein [Bacteroidota bacterium]